MRIENDWRKLRQQNQNTLWMKYFWQNKKGKIEGGLGTRQGRRRNVGILMNMRGGTRVK